jgi:hypothetical protein
MSADDASVEGPKFSLSVQARESDSKLQLFYDSNMRVSRRLRDLFGWLICSLAYRASSSVTPYFTRPQTCSVILKVCVFVCECE